VLVLAVRVVTFEQAQPYRQQADQAVVADG
jgi:hypothetical protein